MGIDLQDIPETAETKLENQKKVISWRRIARAIEKNDFYLKKLSFGQTKTDNETLQILIHKWDNLINETTKTDDKTLIKIIENINDEYWFYFKYCYNSYKQIWY